MNIMALSMWGIVAVFVIFAIIGAVLVAQSLCPARDGRPPRGERRAGAREGIRRYFGPVSTKDALLGPVRRVALELVAASCGFPGFGWLMSARPAIGLPMILLGSATVYGFYPAYLILSGRINDGPLVALEYLPLLALLSAGALAIVEMRAARAVRGDA
jgi:hypothetical protein